LILAALICLAPVAIDGDTLKCLDGTRVRLWGINTPERGQPGAAAATRALQARIGAAVTCQPKGRSFNRIVARCHTLAGVDIGRAQLHSHAVEVCRFSRGFYGRCR
jgi:endonuclease YncB( thermonuclease family)